jgi:DNA-binding MarR family transcriptional regulator
MRDLPLAYLNPLTDIFRELRETYQDMTVAQALAFTTIAANPGVPMKQVEKLTGLSDSSVSRICHILGSQGNRKTEPLHLVYALPMPDDARVLTMHLTQRGRHLAQELAGYIQGARQHGRTPQER